MAAILVLDWLIKPRKSVVSTEIQINPDSPKTKIRLGGIFAMKKQLIKDFDCLILLLELD